MVEATDAVLMILQQIQSTLADHTRRFDQIDGRFDRLEPRLDEVHEGMVTSLGLAGHAHVRHDMINERLKEMSRQIDGLEDLKHRVEVLERTK